MINAKGICIHGNLMRIKPTGTITPEKMRGTDWTTEKTKRKQIFFEEISKWYKLQDSIGAKIQAIRIQIGSLLFVQYQLTDRDCKLCLFCNVLNRQGCREMVLKLNLSSNMEPSNDLSTNMEQSNEKNETQTIFCLFFR